MAKRYDYFYTGLNNSILDFKIELNNSFLAAIPPTDDVPDNAQYGDKIKPDGKGKKPLDQLSASELRQRWASNAAELKKAEATGDESKAKKLKEEQDTLAPALTQEQKDKQNALGPLHRTGITPSDGAPSSLRVDANIKYTDSVEVLKDAAIDPAFLQVRFYEDDSGNEVQQGVEGPFSKSRGSFGYIFNQLKQSADLVNIDVSIIGDPYWFGVPNSLISERVVKAKHGNNSLMKTAASFETGANYFYLNVQTPQQYNTSTGLMEFNRNDMISGFTSVKAVRASMLTRLGLFPNPAQSTTNLIINNPESIAFNVNVFNSFGQMVQQRKVAGGTNTLSLDVHALQAGDYTVDIQMADGSRQNAKLIIKK